MEPTQEMIEQELRNRKSEKLERLRDEFAMHAPNPPKEWRGGEHTTKAIIEWRWAYADKMLNARSKS